MPSLVPRKELGQLLVQGSLYGSIGYSLGGCLRLFGVTPYKATALDRACCVLDIAVLCWVPIALYHVIKARRSS